MLDEMDHVIQIAHVALHFWVLATVVHNIFLARSISLLVSGLHGAVY